MAYRIRSHQSLQTAVNAASAITAALINAGVVGSEDEADETQARFQEKFFAALSAEAEKNNADIEKEDAEGNRPSGSSRPSGGRKGGKGDSGGKKTFTVDEAGDVELRFGAFEGCTVKEVYGFSKKDAEDYGYDKPGKKWLEWAEENSTSGYLRDAIKAYVEGQE